MGLKLEIEITQSSASHSISDFPKITIIYNGEKTIKNDASPGSNSVKKILDDIKSEKPPLFSFLWTPPEKHKSVFKSLKQKGKKELSKIAFRLWIKDDDQKLWFANAIAQNCEIQKADPRSNSAEVVAVKCSDFTYSEIKY